MTAQEYIQHCERLGITVYASAAALGISQSSAQRYGAGTWPVPKTVAKLVRALLTIKELTTRYECG
jgi:hypothetical protein